MNSAAARTVLAVPRDHPAYDGHFPGRPILPGVVLLAEVMAAVRSAMPDSAAPWEIANAKFLDAAEPGLELVLEHGATPSGAVAFEVRSPRGVVASGLLARRPP